MDRRFGILLAISGLGACSTAAPVTEGVLFRAEGWPSILDTGFAVSPFVAAHPVSGGAEATASFTREFFLALEGSSPGTPLVAPEAVYRALEEGGAAAHSRLRALRRDVYRGAEPDPGPLSTLADEVGHRYLLVGWMDEGSAEGLQTTLKDDLTAFNYSMHVHGYSTEEIHGRVSAVVLDLRQARVLWRGSVEYESGWLDGSEPDRAEAEIGRTRAAAAIELASLVATPGDD